MKANVKKNMFIKAHKIKDFIHILYAISSEFAPGIFEDGVKTKKSAE